MSRAYIGLREQPHYRRDAFAVGVKRLGFEPCFSMTQSPKPTDLLIIWNRFGVADDAAKAFERVGATVLVAENGYMGNDFVGDRWYAISRSHHNGAGIWNNYGAARWDNLNVELLPFRDYGRELIVLPQRGIGEPGVAMPLSWTANAASHKDARVRRHPGTNKCTPLQHDLANAYAVYTWGSGAAIKALAWGIPVYSDMPNWIAKDASATMGDVPNRCERTRLQMFRRMAWAMWRLNEIESGFAFDILL
jgi:hypothetical protein